MSRDNGQGRSGYWPADPATSISIVTAMKVPISSRLTGLFGSKVVALVPAVIPVSMIDGEAIVAEVLWVDRFGNAQLNLDPEELAADAYSVQAGDRRRPARRVTHFEALGSGQLGLVVDSTGMVALVLNRASAASEMGLAEGSEIRLLPGDAGNDGVATSVSLGRRPV